MTGNGILRRAGAHSRHAVGNRRREDRGEDESWPHSFLALTEAPYAGGRCGTAFLNSPSARVRFRYVIEKDDCTASTLDPTGHEKATRRSWRSAGPVHGGGTASDLARNRSGAVPAQVSLASGRQDEPKSQLVTACPIG